MKDLMAKSPLHATFVARKLMCDELDTGPAIRRLALMDRVLQLDPGETVWFPLPSDGDEYRVGVRVQHVVETVCAWYAKPRDLVRHLAAALVATQGQVSWVWIELAALMLACKTPVKLAGTSDIKEALLVRVATVQAYTKLPLTRYLDVLGAVKVEVAQDDAPAAATA